MLDPATNTPIRVSVDDATGPYIWTPVSVLDRVRKALLENEVPHWEDHYALSFNGGPMRLVINVERGVDPG